MIATTPQMSTAQIMQGRSIVVSILKDVGISHPLIYIYIYIYI